jgi:ferredoxin
MGKMTSLSTGETFEIPDGTDLLKAYTLNPKLPFKFGCTQGNCGVCVIQIETNAHNLTKPTKQEHCTLQDKCSKGYRLACQCALLGDIRIK